MKTFIGVVLTLALFAVGALVSYCAFMFMYGGYSLFDWLVSGIVMLVISTVSEKIVKGIANAKVATAFIPITCMDATEERKEELKEEVAELLRPAFKAWGLMLAICLKTFEYFFLTLAFNLSIPVIGFLMVWGINFILNKLVNASFKLIE